MSRSRIKQRLFWEMPMKIKISTEKKKLLAVSLFFVILILSLRITQQTMGILTHSVVLEDSAFATKFDVITVAPKEFWPEQDNRIFEYYFLSDIDIQSLIFQVTNNGETEIVCKPYTDSDITYRIYVEEEMVTEFIVAVGETVSFWLVIAPDGLDTNIRDVRFFVDVQQIEEG